MGVHLNTLGAYFIKLRAFCKLKHGFARQQFPRSVLNAIFPSASCMPGKLPVILSPDEVVQFLETVFSRERWKLCRSERRRRGSGAKGC